MATLPSLSPTEHIEEPPLLRISLVDNHFDTDPRLSPPLHWLELCDRLSELRISSEKNGPAWSPGIYGDKLNAKDGRRHNANVLSIGLLVLDLDGKHRPYTADDLREYLDGWTFFAYTTFSSTPQAPRWRVAVPITHPIPAHAYKAEVIRFVEEIELHDIDLRALDPARVHYFPACPTHARSSFTAISGRGRVWAPQEPRWINIEEEITGQGSQDKYLFYDPSATATPLPPPSRNESGLPLPPRERARLPETPLTFDTIRAAFRERAFIEPMLVALGLPSEGLFESGRLSCHSPLRKDEHPSGGVMLHDSGAALFKDFGLLGGPECFTLPQLLAFKCYRDASRREGAGGPGGEFRLTPAEMTVWELRLLHMIGALDPMTTAIPACPDTASPATRAVYDGIRLLIGLRWRVRDWFAGPTALARGFLAAWCGVSEGAAHKAKIWLLKHGILHTKDGGRASRYRGSLFSPGAAEKGVRYGKKSADTGTAWISSASSDPSPATSQPMKQQRRAQAESAPAVIRPDPADPAASHAERVKSAADRFFKQNGYNVYPTIPFLAAATTLTEAEVEATGLGWLWRQHTTTLSAGCAQGSYRQQE